MSSVISISDAATLALHAAAYLAGHPDRVVPSREIAEADHSLALRPPKGFRAQGRIAESHSG